MLAGRSLHAISVATGGFSVFSYVFAARRISFTKLSETRILLRFFAESTARRDALWERSIGKMSKGVEKWVDVG